MYLLFRLPGCLPDPGLAPPSSRRSAAIADKGVIVGGPHFDDTVIHTAFSLEYLILNHLERAGLHPLPSWVAVAKGF
jgi:hypothetical protein